MPQQCLTVNDQILWTQRIQKEAVNARARNDFSVRNAVSVPDVPAKFKPGHVNPFDGTFGKTFHPAQVGWDPQGTMAREFRRCINMQRSGPRERHQFPETMQQEIGWVQGPSGPARDRSEPSGSNPAKLGIGWLQKDGHGGLMAEVAESIHIDPKRLEPSGPPARRSKDGNVREELGAPPFATSQPVVKLKPARREHSGGGTAPASRHSPRAAPSQAGGSERSAKASSSRRAASLPQLARTDPARQLEAQEEAMGGAMAHSRHFLNRHEANRWYHPLSNSDVAMFADAYSKAWGVQLYAKAKP